MRWRKSTAVILLVLFFLCLWPGQTRAAGNTALTLIEITGGALAAVEAVHLIYWFLKKIRFKKKEPRIVPPVQTNQIIVSHQTNVDLGEYENLFLDLGGDTNAPVTVNSNTNQVAVVLTNISEAVSNTNLIAVAAANAVMTNTSVLETNRVTYDTNLMVSHEKITNLTEQEKQDIALFGRDYYYLVSLAYYRVKKYDKSREFMFHSLAIGEKIKEGIAFLKTKFHLSDKAIRRGVQKYISARE